MSQPIGIRVAALADLLIPKREAMLRTLKVGISLFLLWAFVTQDRMTELFWLGLGVCSLSFLPSYLYCKKPFPGLPIFPLFALTHLWAFGLPLLSNEARLKEYPIVYVEAAAVTVAAYLLISTVTYFLVGRCVRPASGEIFVIRKSFESFLWVPLLVAFGFTISTFFGRW